MSTNRVRFSLPAVDDQRGDDNDDSTIGTFKASNVTAEGLEGAKQRAKEVDDLLEKIADLSPEQQQQLVQGLGIGALVDVGVAVEVTAKNQSRSSNLTDSMAYSVSSNDQDVADNAGDDENVASPRQVLRQLELEPEVESPHAIAPVADGVAREVEPVAEADDGSLGQLHMEELDLATTASERGVTDIRNIQYPDGDLAPGGDDLNDAVAGVEHDNDSDDNDGALEESEQEENIDEAD
ncbi:expressed unknown protein [Seminavis robusta]|uniref:Uncharacterized protein n=1 Tax=Seminavis robusta TaxID=568900 RepID=A0A9N8EX41_9STRA|nr:expressed unknown protein [Seminavis robusta]|eukprot:Sro2622_g332860.1 n/a (238) ;mRNA; r:5444-6422